MLKLNKERYLLVEAVQSNDTFVVVNDKSLILEGFIVPHFVQLGCLQ
jgi:hypothetical protein